MAVLKKFVKFTGKHLWSCPFLNKVPDLRLHFCDVHRRKMLENLWFYDAFRGFWNGTLMWNWLNKFAERDTFSQRVNTYWKLNESICRTCSRFSVKTLKRFPWFRPRMCILLLQTSTYHVSTCSKSTKRVLERSLTTLLQCTVDSALREKSVKVRTRKNAVFGHFSRSAV